MNRDDYDKQLIQWVKKHHWDSLEKDKDLLLRHLRTFVGEIQAPPVCECLNPMIISKDICSKCLKDMR